MFFDISVRVPPCFLLVNLIYHTFKCMNNSERTTTLGASSTVKIMKIKSWDGKDASPPQEEAIEGNYVDDEIDVN